jgi:hypothetical protein
MRVKRFQLGDGSTQRQDDNVGLWLKRLPTIVTVATGRPGRRQPVGGGKDYEFVHRDIGKSDVSDVLNAD